MEQIHKTKHDRIKSRKAVAPIIATLLMIAIAVVGGVMIYVFTQGFFGNSSISSSPSVDTITMVGYDMRAIPDTTGITTHELFTLVGYGAIPLGDPAMMEAGEEGAIFIKNVGSKQYTISKLEVNDLVVDFDGTGALTADGTWGMITAENTADTVIDDQLIGAATVLPGQEATLLISFDAGNQAAAGRTIPVKITSASGSVFNFNVVIGSKA